MKSRKQYLNNENIIGTSGHSQMFQMMCEASHNAFLYYCYEKDEVLTLGDWESFFDFDVKTGKDLALLMDEVDKKQAPELRKILFPEEEQNEGNQLECRMKKGNKWYSFEGKVTYDESGRPINKIICIRNVTRFKNQQDELNYLAFYDEQTALYNRNYFVKLLRDFIQRAEEEKEKISVLIIDIDDFKKINDGVGMLVGDEVIQQYGQFLGTFSCDDCIVGHINSDIYCMALYGADARGVEHVYKQIQQRISRGFMLSNGMEVHLTVSVGVAEYPDASKSALELINCAEIVMFKAKSMGKASIRFFDAPILQDFLQTASIENKLKEATFGDNFFLYYQPQYYADNKTLRGVEALIRWKDDDKMISPAFFIPIAEKNGAIISIGDWVIEESIRSYAKWKKHYKKPFVMSINISAIQYNRQDFVQKLMETIYRYKVKPEEIELEITESALIEDFEDVKKKLLCLREQGIRISLDDFGTGYSSLSYLNGLPINTLKIDKSFVDKVSTDATSRIIMESVVSLVNKLGYESVAEGVEKKEQLDYMKNIGCSIIQGFYLGKPMPGEEVEKLLVAQA